MGAFLTWALLAFATPGLAQSTIYSEDFTGESGSSTSTLVGDQWSATTSSGTMSIDGNVEFRFTGQNSNGTHTCTWTSDPISIAGYTSMSVSFSSTGSGGTSAPTLSMTNGSVSSGGGAFTPDGGATTTVITFTFSVGKNKYRTVDNISFTGTITCTPTTWYVDADGDGLGDAGTSQSSCDQPAGYVANSTDNCDDLSACNYDDAGNAACTYPGCTNASACNYNSAAGCDDASCTYASDRKSVV